MDIMKDIRDYQMRRQRRLDSRRMDAGSTRLPYALCKKEGIDTTGMTPSEAWKALEGQTGTSAKSAYKSLGAKSKPRKGTIESANVSSKTSWTGKEMDKLRDDINNELNSLPNGATVKVARGSYTKLKNGIWGDAHTPHDPRYQKSQEDFLDKVYHNALLGGKAPTYEVEKRKKTGNVQTLTKERRESLEKEYPGSSISIRKKTSGYTDFDVNRGGGYKKSVRVYEDKDGNTMFCVITDDLRRKMQKLQGGKAS